MEDPPLTPPAPRRRRRVATALAGMALLPVAIVLGADSVLLGPEPAQEPWTGALPDPEPAQHLQPGQDADGDGLDDALEAAVARRHAPRWRFAGRNPEGGTPQDQDEAYFPMSVARFLGGLDGGGFRVPGGLVHTLQPGRFEETRVTGFPTKLIGDPLGEAPLYTHVYPGERPGEVFCEYYAWYGFDRADGRVLGIPLQTGGHRGDWEHVAYRIGLDPPRLLEGFYYGHAKCLRVSREQLERVEGEHPVVYVSQGKHASYPAAVRIPSVNLPQWLVGHIDVANGRGPAWDAWRSPLIDLGEREHPRPEVARWFAYQGRWGPDGTEILGLELGASPTGPGAKPSWGRNGPGSTPWADHLRERGGRLVKPAR